MTTIVTRPSASETLIRQLQLSPRIKAEVQDMYSRLPTTA